MATSRSPELTRGFTIAAFPTSSVSRNLGNTMVYVHAGWIGVSLLGTAISAVALLVWALTRKLSAVRK